MRLDFALETLEKDEEASAGRRSAAGPHPQSSKTSTIDPFSR
jgi:hypothetical protein